MDPIALRSRSLALLAAALLAGCADDPFSAPAPDGSADAGADVPRIVRADVPATPRDVPAVDVPRNTNPVVVGVVPDHGPFTGGNSVVVRGSNFTPESVVTFGGALVQPRDTVANDQGRLTVLPPAGRAGEVDVTVVVDGRTATLPRGYRYDAIQVEPSDGSPAGNTLLTVRGLGTHFTDATAVTLDGLPCTGVRVGGPEQLTCLTPAHPEGRVDVTVLTGDERIAVTDAFNFTDSAESARGGLGGGPILGNINVTVLAGNTGDPIPNALVFLGDDPQVAPPRSTRTNDRGRASVGFPELRGPTTLTISAHCFSSQTVQVFDARNVSVYLYAQMIPACAAEGMPPESTPSRGTYGTQVSGELVWEGPNEFAPNPWRNIPEPRAGERRVARVFATTADILTTPNQPAAGGQVVEVVTPGYGGRGYPFSISTRPASLAIYAIAGIENNRDPSRFTPYIMGVARGVLGSPRAMITNVVVPMNLPLDHQTDVRLANLPPVTRDGPNRLRVEGFIDLGGEGVIARPDVTAYGRDVSDNYNLVALPPFSGPLADARLIVRATYGVTSGRQSDGSEYLSPPSSAVVIGGVTTPDDTVRVDDWVGIPEFEAPTEGGRLPNDRTVRFVQRGNNPDMFNLSLSGDVLYWQTWARNTERSFRFPDLSGVMGLRDLPTGAAYYMYLTGFRVSGFVFNEFRYNNLSQLYWSAYAARNLTFTR